MKRWLAVGLAILIFVNSSLTLFACDEKQVEDRVCEIVFGDDTENYSGNDNTIMLLDALYLCSEQADKQGSDKLDFLKEKKVSKLPALDKINLKSSELLACSHISWEQEYTIDKKKSSNRKKILQNTVNKVFDFGALNNWFGSETGKCNSFAALLYYSHILADFLADDPEDTEINYRGAAIPAYCGEATIELSGGRPSFTKSQMNAAETTLQLSSLDRLGRAGMAFAVLGPNTISSSDTRQQIGYIEPAGWRQKQYDGVVNSSKATLFNRCHLIGHQLAGNDEKRNLITGTNYLNETGMKPYEDEVAEYIKKTGNCVLYRATPVYYKDNLVASGVKLEAYSLEDSGTGICFNIYCYNVQPGIEIDYASGKSEKADFLSDSTEVIPFAISNPSDTNPDLLYSIKKHLEILFEDQKDSKSGNYSTLMNDISVIGNEARSIGSLNDNQAQIYMKLKQCEYELFVTLKTNVPPLLKKEKFFNKTYK